MSTLPGGIRAEAGGARMARVSVRMATPMTTADARRARLPARRARARDRRARVHPRGHRARLARIGRPRARGDREGAPRLRLHRARRAALRGAGASPALGEPRSAPGDPPAPARSAARQPRARVLSEEARRRARRDSGSRAARGGARGGAAPDPGGAVRPRRAHHAAARVGLDVALEQVEAARGADREHRRSPRARRGRAAADPQPGRDLGADARARRGAARR